MKIQNIDVLYTNINMYENVERVVLEKVKCDIMTAYTFKQTFYMF